MKPDPEHGGLQIARALARCGVRHLFTLVGGHISPILVAARGLGIQVVDTRHEATAAFAADAVSRLSGTVGAAAVTAGTGVTNTLTSVHNARLAQSPMLLIGGATATVLAEVWLLYGDGALGYGLAEFDTFCRRLPVIALVGNDASWAQIARDQVALLGDDVATRLERSDYHRAAEALGAKGLLLETTDQVPETLKRAQALAAAGHPVLINAHITTTDFRQGSLSL